MAISVNSGKVINMTAADDEVTEALFVKSIRVVADAPTIGDDCVFVDPDNTSDEIWRTRAPAGANVVEEALIERYLKNGIRLHTNDDNKFEAYISYD